MKKIVKTKEPNEVSKKIVKIMKQRGISMYAIQKATGIYAGTLEKAFKLPGSWRTAIGLMKIADFFGMDVNELLPGERVKYSKEKKDRIQILENRVEELTKKLKEKEDYIISIRKVMRL
ncbi:MAG: helix-turn-helix transcriptional regulator [Ignavibacteriae bacterium]|nr:helix-turn-helix transcriptional regulator [Ignavibacteriota bacterium]